MPHGGKRDGAGRPTKAEKPTLSPTAVRLTEDVKERLVAVCEGLSARLKRTVSQAEVFEMGVDAAEKKLSRLKRG